MSIFNFKKNKEKKEEKESFFIDKFYDITQPAESDRMFRAYCMRLEEKYTELELVSYSNITQGLLFLIGFMWRINSVRELELHRTKENYSEYQKEDINLEKISRIIYFFYTYRVDEIKQYYRSWMVEYYEEKNKPIFILDRMTRNDGYFPDIEFTRFVYEKILDKIDVAI